MVSIRSSMIWVARKSSRASCVNENAEAIPDSRDTNPKPNTAAPTRISMMLYAMVPRLDFETANALIFICSLSDFCFFGLICSGNCSRAVFWTSNLLANLWAQLSQTRGGLQELRRDPVLEKVNRQAGVSKNDESDSAFEGASRRGIKSSPPSGSAVWNWDK